MSFWVWHVSLVRTLIKTMTKGTTLQGLGTVPQLALLYVRRTEVCTHPALTKGGPGEDDVGIQGWNIFLSHIDSSPYPAPDQGRPRRGRSRNLERLGYIHSSPLKKIRGFTKRPSGQVALHWPIGNRTPIVTRRDKTEKQALQM